MKDLHDKLVKAFQEADCYDNESARASIAVGIFNELLASELKGWADHILNAAEMVEDDGARTALEVIAKEIETGE